ncbi:MAG TPA: 3-deoxy-D-manno-octulosonic acid transferase, partial [Alphaproteobacteria bacterium]|nr:3-deoxy-D-manno-octulosonic acid transferase [Alphaproteobacteria bacterium]
WPNMLTICKAKDIPTIVVNARLSEKSQQKYQRFQSLFSAPLQTLTHILCQDENDQRRFKTLGLNQAQLSVTGTVKFDIQFSESIINSGLSLRQQLGKQRPVVIASSTHKGEDEISIDIYKQLQKQHKDLLMLLIPRHPHRGDDIAKLLAESNLDHVQRSKTKGLEQASSMNVYLADTLGEVGLWYALADVVLMGGTFTWAGHNPLEPLKAGKPTYSGPNMQNFRDMSDVLTKKGVLVICEDEQEVTNHLNNALSDKEFLSSFVEKSQTAIESMTGATDIVITALRAKIKG